MLTVKVDERKRKRAKTAREKYKQKKLKRELAVEEQPEELIVELSPKFIQLVRETFDLEFNNDKAISTTRDNTTVNTVLSRHIDNLTKKHYVSYFSHHQPISSIIDVNSIQDSRYE